MKCIYISTVGKTVEAVVNSFWCAVRTDNIKVEKVVLLCSRTDKKRGIEGTQQYFDQIKSRILNVLKRMGIKLPSENVEKEVIEEEKISSVYDAIKRIYEKYKEEYTMCVDITGGRKTMSSGAVLAARDLKLKCYYFWLYNPQRDGRRQLDEMLSGEHYELVKVHELWTSFNLS